MKQMNVINFSIMCAARSKYLHYSKIKDNLLLLHNLRLKNEHEHVIHISIKCVIDSTYF